MALSPAVRPLALPENGSRKLGWILLMFRVFRINFPVGNANVLP